jgi:hypothetical protein
MPRLRRVGTTWANRLQVQALTRREWADEFLWRAKELEEQAAEAEAPAIRQVLLTLADYYLQLATQASEDPYG